MDAILTAAVQLRGSGKTVNLAIERGVFSPVQVRTILSAALGTTIHFGPISSPVSSAMTGSVSGQLPGHVHFTASLDAVPSPSVLHADAVPDAEPTADDFGELPKRFCAVLDRLDRQLVNAASRSGSPRSKPGETDRILTAFLASFESEIARALGDSVTLIQDPSPAGLLPRLRNLELEAHLLHERTPVHLAIDLYELDDPTRSLRFEIRGATEARHAYLRDYLRHIESAARACGRKSLATTRLDPQDAPLFDQHGDFEVQFIDPEAGDEQCASKILS